MKATTTVNTEATAPALADLAADKLNKKAAREAKKAAAAAGRAELEARLLAEEAARAEAAGVEIAPEFVEQESCAHSLPVLPGADDEGDEPAAKTLPKSGFFNPAIRARYLTTREPGLVAVDCNDQVANLLRGKELDETYTIAAKTLGEAESVLRAKYAHLNPGQQRMNLGNRIRGVYKKQAAAAKPTV